MSQIELQIDHAKALELLDSFHRIQSILYQVMLSPEMDAYYTSTSDTLKANERRLVAFIADEETEMPYLNSQWTIYGSRGNILFSTQGKEAVLESNSLLFYSPSASLSENKGQLIFSIPTSYKFNSDRFGMRKDLGVISVTIPLKSIIAIHDDLISIDEISFDLSSKKFHAQFQKSERSEQIH